jgi:hypothetical protein
MDRRQPATLSRALSPSLSRCRPGGELSVLYIETATQHPCVVRHCIGRQPYAVVLTHRTWSHAEDNLRTSGAAQGPSPELYVALRVRISDLLEARYFLCVGTPYCPPPVRLFHNLKESGRSPSVESRLAIPVALATPVSTGSPSGAGNPSLDWQPQWRWRPERTREE